MSVLRCCSLFRQILPVTKLFDSPKSWTCVTRNMSGKRVLALLTEGTEEMELVISVDVLRRAGIDVTVAGLSTDKVYKCSRGVLVNSDSTLDEALSKGPYDVVLLPGGPGYKTFASSEKVGAVLKDQEKGERFIAAICAAPVVLKAHNVCSKKKITCYPSVKDQMVEADAYTYVDSKVVVDGKLITSQGPGTAYDFGLSIIEQLVGKDAATQVAKALLL
ncbi:Parkinson disease protein 7-like protein [Frankliniella fusca]|uniref:Parkinson disease protein 7-like protein n=1 Tax=Frankliniella fusca TaxID=407009 RepID=A0AAE1LU59_9NEOP|nr:Parkinson disease protein 7-like protein [Frankliniella fusca]